MEPTDFITRHIGWTFNESTGDLVHVSGYALCVLGPRGRWYPTDPKGRVLKNARRRAQGYKNLEDAFCVLMGLL